MYVDTPGIHEGAKRALNRYMNRAATAAVHDVDAVLIMVDVRRVTREDELVLRAIEVTKAPCVLLLNKIDRLSHRHDLLPKLQAFAELSEKFAEVVPVSALRGDSIDHLHLRNDGQSQRGDAHA